MNNNNNNLMKRSGTTRATSARRILRHFYNHIYPEVIFSNANCKIEIFPPVEDV